MWHSARRAISSVLASGGLFLVLAAALVLMDAQQTTAFADDNCSAQGTKCAIDGKGFGETFVTIIKSCKGVRKCRQECRQEKRDCVSDARGEKRDCVDVCRDRFGRGADFRHCRQNCRQEKRETKQECRQDKRDCREVCRESFNNDACKEARREISKVGAQAIGSCASFVACAAASSD